MAQEHQPERGIRLPVRAAALGLGLGTAVAALAWAAPAALSPAAVAPAAVSPLLARTVVAVTAHGAVVVLSLPSGRVEQTLLRSGALGDELSLTPDGRTVYVAVRHGCYGEIESVPAAGGPATVVTAGVEPAVSPDGGKLALARQPALTPGCAPKGNPATAFTVVVRDLRTRAERAYPADPRITASGLPDPVSHLSWSADGRRLLVTSPSIEDNEGWKLSVFEPPGQRYWLSASRALVPVAHAAAGWYDSEGVFARSGALLVATKCCSGLGRNGGTPSSVRVDIVSASTGAVVQQLATPDPKLPVASLASGAGGHDLLYLSGGELYVSAGGTATRTAGGLVAATFGGPSLLPPVPARAG